MSWMEVEDEEGNDSMNLEGRRDDVDEVEVTILLRFFDSFLEME